MPYHFPSYYSNRIPVYESFSSITPNISLLLFLSIRHLILCMHIQHYIAGAFLFNFFQFYLKYYLNLNPYNIMLHTCFEKSSFEN